MGALLDHIDLDLPDGLPILHYGLFSRDPGHYKRRVQTKRDEDASRRPLSALLSCVLLAFTIEFERESDLSLAICANVVRVLNEKGVRARDLPVLSGVSKKSISMALGILQKAKLAVVESESDAGRTKLVLLTAKGQRAQDAYRKLLAAIEARSPNALRSRNHQQSSRVAGELGHRSFVRKSLRQRAWRRAVAVIPWPAAVPRQLASEAPEAHHAPHFSTVLHRGAFPDGS